MDYPYVIFALIIACLSYLNWKQPQEKYFKWAVIVVFAFFALRAPVVGADTWNYYRFLIGERNFYNADERELESAFLVYHDFCHSVLFKNGLLVMAFNSFLSLVSIYLLFKKYAYDKVMAILVMILIFGYLNWFCALRQILGYSFLLIGYLVLLSDDKLNITKRWVIYIGLSYIGYLFHTSIIIYAVIFAAVIFWRNGNRFQYNSLIIGTTMFGIILQNFNVLDFFNFILSMGIDVTSRLDGYFINGELEEMGTLNLVLRQSVVSLFVINALDNEKINHPFTKIYIVGISITNLLVSVPMIHRFNFLFWPFAAVVFTWILGAKYQQQLKYRKCINMILVLVFLYFGRSYIIQQIDYDLEASSRNHPYYWIWEDYRDHPSITIWGS